MRGTLNGYAFRSSIFPDGRGGHHMMFNKAMQEGARTKPGDMVRVEMGPDTRPRAVAVPPDLKKALGKNAAARAFFEKLSPSAKKMYVGWIVGAKQADTRTRRIIKAMEMLRAGKKLG